MKKIKPKKCRECGTEFMPRYKTTERFCSPICAYKNKPNTKHVPIKKRSKKRQKQELDYKRDRLEFLSSSENKMCFIDGCGKPANTIEHRKGRVGYGDEWARENNIPLLLDKRFWAPCCLEHNLKLENDPEMSKKYQLSKIHNGKKI